MHGQLNRARAHRHPGAGFGLCALTAIAAFARRARLRAARRPGGRGRKGGGAGVLGGGAASLLALHARDASASVSITVFFDELLQRSTAVAVVTPTERKSVWEEGGS